jgi:hypothetical protein
MAGLVPAPFMLATRTASAVVIAGLDPAIHDDVPRMQAVRIYDVASLY